LRVAIVHEIWPIRPHPETTRNIGIGLTGGFFRALPTQGAQKGFLGQKTIKKML